MIQVFYQKFKNVFILLLLIKCNILRQTQHCALGAFVIYIIIYSLSVKPPPQGTNQVLCLMFWFTEQAFFASMKLNICNQFNLLNIEVDYHLFVECEFITKLMVLSKFKISCGGVRGGARSLKKVINTWSRNLCSSPLRPLILLCQFFEDEHEWW